MALSTPRRTRPIAVVHLLLALLCTLVVASPGIAQDDDRVPPVISFEPLAEGRRGDTQVFSARVDDADGAIERVTFHYRPAGTSAYTTREMTAIPGTDIYTVSVDDLGPEVEAVQFYFDAVDAAGNRSIEGFAFDPLERLLVGPDVPVQAEVDEGAAPIEADGLSTRRKILYGVLGVVAVGAIAAAAGGGSDGGGGDDGGTVPVTIVADPL